MTDVYVIRNDFGNIVGIFVSKHDADKCCDNLSETERRWFKMENYEVRAYPYPVNGYKDSFSVNNNKVKIVYCAVDTWTSGICGVFASMKDVRDANIQLYDCNDHGKLFPYTPAVYKIELDLFT